jgi:TPR repeat protein
MVKASSSFLKKRTKKRLFSSRAPADTCVDPSATVRNKSFLVLFFKKELLAFFASSNAIGRASPRGLLAMSFEKQRELFSGPQEAAFPWVRMAAEHGLAEAQVRLGRMLLEGTGCRQDKARALAWFLTAARDGNAEAMNMVGRCHENGWGTAPDPATAAIWFTRAAERGDAWAQYNLGHLLLDGSGVPMDHAAALAWYRRAADQGHARAMNLVGRCLEQGWGTSRDLREAEQWYKRSAEGGYFRGQYNYATLLLARGECAAAQHWLGHAQENATPVVAQSIAKLLSHA